MQVCLIYSEGKGSSQQLTAGLLAGDSEWPNNCLSYKTVSPPQMQPQEPASLPQLSSRDADISILSVLFFLVLLFRIEKPR